MLTITTTHEPATDLGYLLHKHPDRLQAFELAFGAAHVFYPEASDQRCTAALMLEIDPIRLTRRGGSAQGGKFLQDYINDRPYAASSHLSVAIAKVYRTAMSGRCDARPELAGSPIPLTAQVDSVSSQHGPELARRMLEPLGYEVQTETLPLDPAFPDWGDSVLHNLTIASGERTLADLLRHLYVLLPVLDNQKHYWVGNDELEKLMRFGEGWLESHPAREMISRRYLGFRRGLTLRAQEQLEAAAEAVAEADDGDDEQAQGEKPEGPGEKTRVNESDLERPMSLHAQRIQAVLEEVRKSGAGSVLDLGCGEGRLLEELLKQPGLRLAGLEVSGRRLGVARQRLGAKGAASQEARRVQFLHGSLLYGDPRLEGYAAAVAMEVVEHFDPSKLDVLEDALLGRAKPGTLIVTTPNREYNVLFENMETRFRHRDHRFEWTREEFQAWAEGAAGRRGYTVRFRGIGPEHETHGRPTQMAVFKKEDTE